MHSTRIRLAALLSVLAVGVVACGGGSTTRAPSLETVTPAKAAEVLGNAPPGLVILDVRTPEEFAAARLAGAVNIDFYATDFGDRLAALDREVPYLLYCRTGNRSAEAGEMMRRLGFMEVYEIEGGIVAWAEAGLPYEVP